MLHLAKMEEWALTSDPVSRSRCQTRRYNHARSNLWRYNHCLKELISRMGVDVISSCIGTASDDSAVGKSEAHEASKLIFRCDSGLSVETCRKQTSLSRVSVNLLRSGRNIHKSSSLLAMTYT